MMLLFFLIQNPIDISNWFFHIFRLLVTTNGLRSIDLPLHLIKWWIQWLNLCARKYLPEEDLWCFDPVASSSKSHTKGFIVKKPVSWHLFMILNSIEIVLNWTAFDEHMAKRRARRWDRQLLNKFITTIFMVQSFSSSSRLLLGDQQ